MPRFLLFLLILIVSHGGWIVRAQNPCTDPATQPVWDNSWVNNADGTGTLTNLRAPAGFAKVALDLARTRNLTLLRPRLPDDTPIAEFSPTGTSIPPFNPALGEGNAEWTYTGATPPTELRVPIAAEYVGSSEAVVLLIDVCGRSRAYDIIDGPLPVELVAFEALLDGNDVLLRWQTAGELSNLGFEVQHYAEGAWQPLGFVEGAGTTTFDRHYRYVASHLPPGYHRFRLRQLDAGGGAHYSPEVELHLALPEAFVLTDVYPNPFGPRATFSLTVRQSQHVQVALYDVLGRRVRLLYDGPLPAGQPHPFTLDGAGLPGGTYFYRVTGETFAQTRMVARAR